MDAAFMKGISYLSWKEEAKARAIAAADWGRESLADISISPDDTENLQLMAKVREEIATWRRRSTVSLYYLLSHQTLSKFSSDYFIFDHRFRCIRRPGCPTMPLPSFSTVLPNIADRFAALVIRLNSTIARIFIFEYRSARARPTRVQ